MTTLQKLGECGHIGGYDVLILEHQVLVSSIFEPGRMPRRFEIPNYGTSIGELARQPGFRLNLASSADETILYLVDRDDDDFGYALNLDYPDLSEWGYCR